MLCGPNFSNQALTKSQSELLLKDPLRNPDNVTHKRRSPIGLFSRLPSLAIARRCRA
jgi:hypothetical protein